MGPCPGPQPGTCAFPTCPGEPSPAAWELRCHPSDTGAPRTMAGFPACGTNGPELSLTCHGAWPPPEGADANLLQGRPPLEGAWGHVGDAPTSAQKTAAGRATVQGEAMPASTPRLPANPPRSHGGCRSWHCPPFTCDSSLGQARAGRSLQGGGICFPGDQAMGWELSQIKHMHERE